MSKKNKILVVAIVMTIVLLVAVGVLLIFLGDEGLAIRKKNDEESKQIINFTEACFDLFYSGCNLETSVNVELNDTEVKKIFKEKINPEYETGTDWLNVASNICSDILIRIDKTYGLSNGDIIKISFDVPEKYLDKYNLQLGETEFEVIVSGRMDRQEYDPFEDIVFVVNNDDIKTVRVINSNDLLKGYDINYLYDFVGGDNANLTIEELQFNDEIQIYFNEDVANELALNGLYPTRMYTTVKVEENNISKVTDTADLTEEFILSLKNEANNIIYDLYNKYNNIVVTEMIFTDAWFTDNYSIGENKLTLVYQVDFIYGGDAIEETIYLALSTNMIYKDKYGELIILGTQNEPNSAITLIDSSIMLQLQGEKLEDIIDRHKDYTKID